MAYIHLYKGDVTSGGVDGTEVSEGTELEPIQIGPLNALQNQESDPLKLAIRCDDGYKTDGATTITPTGLTSAKWALAPDDAGEPGVFGEYGVALTIEGSIPDTNLLIWAKAKATDDEDPAEDTEVDLVIVATIVPE